MTCPITRSSSKLRTLALRNKAKWLLSFHVVSLLIGTIIWHHFVFVNTMFRNLSASSWIDPQNRAQTNSESNAIFSTTAGTSNLSDTQDTIMNAISTQNLNSTQGSVSTKFRSMANTVLLGQFNYDTNFDIIEKWRNIWSKHFANIIVAGPFSSVTQERMKAAGILYHIGREDQGYVSPYENLLQIMRQLQNKGQNDSSAQYLPFKDADGVLYMHDDGLLNIKGLLHGRFAFPTDSFIIADYSHGLGLKRNMGYAITVSWEWGQGPNGTELTRNSPFFSFEHLPDDDGLNHTTHKNIAGLLHVMPNWPNLKMCLTQQVTMLSHYNQTLWDEFADYSKTTITRPFRSVTSLQENLTVSSELVTRTSYRFTFPGYSQSDLLYVPLQYTDIMDRAMKPHIRGEVFLECAIPTIQSWVIKSLKRSHEARNSMNSNGQQSIQPPVPSIEQLSLCTDFSPVRGTKAMIMNCLRVSSNWGFYHPFKLRQFGAREFDTWLTLVQRASRPNGTPTSHMSK